MSVFPRIPAKLNNQFNCQGLWNFNGNRDDTCGLSPASDLGSNQGTPTQTFVYARDHTGRQCLMSRGTDQAIIGNTGISRLRIYGDITVQAVVWLPTFEDAAAPPSGINFIHFSGSSGAFDTENHIWHVGTGAFADRMEPRIYWEGPAGVFHQVKDTDFTIDNGRWFHIVGVRDGTTGLLYVNGLLIKTELSMSPPTGGNNSRVRVGKQAENIGGLPNGTMISSLKVSNRTLTQQEILQEYNRVRGSV